MKRKITIQMFFFLLSVSLKAQFDHQHINLLGNFSDPNVIAEPTYGIKYQSCWGWVDTLHNKEYGIIGSTAGTYIIDVTDPSNPVQADYIPHRQTDCIWHEYKTYKNYLYIISDDAGNNSLQIADLSYLPDSAYVLYDSTDIFIHAHTLFIDGDKLYVASVTNSTSYSSMNVYSLADPTHPALLRRLDQDFPFISSVHDMFVSHDTVYASCGYDGLQIFHYDSVSNVFALLGTLPGASNLYNHSSCLSPDYSTLYVCEEVPAGQPVKLVDVSNAVSPVLIDTFYTNQGATPHNPYLLDNLLIIAAYQDGVYIYDVSNSTSPVRVGYFDTYPANPAGTYPWPAYAGAWAAYPYLPSGTLLVSDMQSGLFCLDISGVSGIHSPKATTVKLYPNPSTGTFRIEGVDDGIIELINMTGQVCFKKIINQAQSVYDVSKMSKGIYTVRLTFKNGVSQKKLVIG